MMTPIARAGLGGGSARMGLVLVHGRGGSAADMLGLPSALGVPDLALAAPEAPGRSWWPTSFLAPSTQMEPFVERGLDAVEAAVEALVAEGLPRDRIALMGFSQGGCLALEYAARRGDRGLAAVFGLSAGLVGTADDTGGPDPALYGFGPKRFDYEARLDGLPMTLTVHEEDPHIPLRRAEESLAAFRGLGAGAELHVAPGPGHGLTEAGIAAMRKALQP